MILLRYQLKPIFVPVQQSSESPPPVHCTLQAPSVEDRTCACSQVAGLTYQPILLQLLTNTDKDKGRTTNRQENRLHVSCSNIPTPATDFHTGEPNIGISEVYRVPWCLEAHPLIQRLQV